MPQRMKSSIILAATALAVIAIACGGDDDAPAESDSAAVSASVSTIVAATPVRLASVADLTSFRYTVEVLLTGSAANLGEQTGGFSIDLDLSLALAGAVIVPDREQSTVTADFGFLKLETESIKVGDRTWSRESGGEWQLDAGGGLDELDFAFSPLDILGGDLTGEGLSEFQAVLDTLDAQRESVNGIDTLRYDLDAEDFERVFDNFGDDATALPTDDFEQLTISLWIARDSGIPVRMLIEGSSEGADGEGTISLDLSLSDLNSDEIEIEPPI